MSFYILSLNPHVLDTALQEAVCQETVKNSKITCKFTHYIALSTFEGNTCSWLHFRDTFEALIVNNPALSNVQKFHCLIASMKKEAKELISNLQITNEIFLVAWQLDTQRYNNKQLIAMMHAKHLCHLPQVKKGDASSIRQLINPVSSNMKALQALSMCLFKI